MKTGSHTETFERAPTLNPIKIKERAYMTPQPPIILPCSSLLTLFDNIASSELKANDSNTAKINTISSCISTKICKKNDRPMEIPLTKTPKKTIFCNEQYRIINFCKKRGTKANPIPNTIKKEEICFGIK